MENEVKVIDRRIQEEPETAITVPDSPNAVVLMAMQKGYAPEFIEKMLDLQMKFEANEARKAYFAALASFKAEAPPVKKDKYNKYFDSWYTSLGQLLDHYNPYLGKVGLSLTFPTPEQTEKTMKAFARLSHRLGYSETMGISAPIDQAAIGKVSGQRSRNPIQDVKSTFTYLRSATAEAILGVTGTDASLDDDGNSTGVAYITTDQATEINDKIKDLHIDLPKFLDYLSTSLKQDIDSIEKIPQRGYKTALAAIKAKEDKKNAD